MQNDVVDVEIAVAGGECDVACVNNDVASIICRAQTAAAAADAAAAAVSAAAAAGRESAAVAAAGCRRHHRSAVH